MLLTGLIIIILARARVASKVEPGLLTWGQLATALICIITILLLLLLLLVGEKVGEGVGIGGGVVHAALGVIADLNRNNLLRILALLHFLGYQHHRLNGVLLISCLNHATAFLIIDFCFFPLVSV